MSKDETAVPRLVAIDRRQLFLRTVDVEQLVEQEHCVRSIWELVGRLDLSLYYAQIAAVEGRAGREHTDPQLLISLWIYAYSRGEARSTFIKPVPPLPVARKNNFFTASCPRVFVP